MGLQVWLPLTKDLRNQGLATITSTGTPIFKNIGKIGSKSLDLNTRINFNCTALANVQTFSIAFWAKTNQDSNITGDWMDVLGFTDISSSGSSGQLRWETCYTYGAPTRGVSAHDNATYATVQGPSGQASIKGNWNHFCITVDPLGTGRAVEYQDGVKIGDYAANGGHLTGSFWTGETNKVNGEIQDIRIYNHALSQMEVKELAKGLVLHYKLDNNDLGGENLALSTASKIVTATATGTDVSTTTTLDYGLLTNWSRIRGQTITISCDIELINAVNTTGVSNYRVGIEPALKFTDNTRGYYGIWIGLNSTPKTISQRYTRSYTLPDKDVQSVLQNGMYIQHLTNGSATIKNIKVELGSAATRWSPAPADLGLDTSIVYDCSGYNNNGVITGNISMSPDSIRYEVSTNFSSGSYIRVEKRPTVCLPKDAITVNLWVNTTTWYNPISCAEGGGWNFKNNSGICFPVYISGIGYKVAQSSITTSSLNNAWHMLTGTMDKNNIKIYIDGEEVGTVANGSSNGIGYANNYLFINAEAGGDSTTPASASRVGKTSDVRIYATALTAAQIKELYNTSMSIDNKGNIYTRELVEI